METQMVGSLLVVKLNMIQSVGLAIIMYFIGTFIRNRIPILVRLSIPGPVIGGLLFACVSTFLRTQGVVGFEMDTTLQTVLMNMFFCTIGMGASLVLMKKGGVPLLIFFVLAMVVALMQNLVGIALAKATGIHPVLGIIGGAVTLMGGLGTGGAFGPYFENLGVSGATTAAIACATFGMVAGSLMGGPFGETLINKYKITLPHADTTHEDLCMPEEEGKVSAAAMMETLAFVLIAMSVGAVMGVYFTDMGMTLPSYIGAMMAAAVVRNIGDLTKSFTINSEAVDFISDISLTLYLTMAICGLKLWELLNLALPLMVILLGQIIFMALFAWLVVYFVMGRNYEAVQMSVGMIGFGMGAMPNALCNMAALSEKYGPAPRAYLLVSLVGAFLIDFVNALIITGMGSMYL